MRRAREHSMRGPWARVARPRPPPPPSPPRHCRLKLPPPSDRLTVSPSGSGLRGVPVARARALRERVRRPEAASLPLPPRSPLALPASHRPQETAQLRQTINFLVSSRGERGVQRRCSPRFRGGTTKGFHLSKGLCVVF